MGKKNGSKRKLVEIVIYLFIYLLFLYFHSLCIIHYAFQTTFSQNFGRYVPRVSSGLNISPHSYALKKEASCSSEMIVTSKLHCFMAYKNII